MKRFLALFAMAAILLVAGCKPDPFLSISPTDLSFGQDGGSQTVKVTANYPWTASASGTGISVSPSSGEGDATVTITVAGASSTSETSGTVSFRSEGLSASVSVKQDAKSAIVVGDVARIPAEGGTFKLDIQYNTEYTVEIEKSAQSWITFNGTKAMQSGKLEFTFAANETTEARTGKVTVTDRSGKVQPITLTFVQEEVKVIKVGDITPIPAEGGTFKVDIQYNTEYTVEIEKSAKSWIVFNGTKAMQSGKLEFTFAANDGEERSGKVTVTDKSGKVAPITLTFVQDSPAFLALERAALIAFYKANDGDNWKHNNNWCSDKPLKDWYGIEMTPDGLHVRSISVGYNNTDGAIPEQIGDLSCLEVIRIYNTVHLASKSSPLPESIGRLTKLKTLVLQNYSLSGTLPASLFDLQNLETLRITGAEDMTPMPIPKQIGNLTELKELDLSAMNLTGALIPEIGELTKLQILKLYGNDLSGSIPDSFGNLINLEKIDLSGNKLSGDIPPSFYLLDNYWKLWPNLVHGNEFTQDDIRNAKIPAPKSPPIKMLSGKTLDLAEEIARNQFTVLFSTCPSGEGWNIIPALVNLYNSHKDEGLGVITYYDNNANNAAGIERRDKDFKQYLADYNVPWDSFIRHMNEDNPKHPFYAEKGLKMYPFGAMDEIVVIGPDGTVDYTTNIDSQFEAREKLEHFIDYLSAKLGTPIVHYETTDYSADGKVTLLQKASVGRGVDLVITGDAFSDRLIADGTMERLARQATDDFFSQEPYTSMRDRFNVYLVNAVSKHEDYFSGCSTVFSGSFWGPTFVGGDDEKVLSYAAKALDEERMDDVVVLVLMNSGLGGGTAYLYDSSSGHYAGGASVTYIPYRDPKVIDGISRNAETVIHEAGGHGFGHLADEYAIIANGRPTAEVLASLKQAHQNHWFVNVDVTSDTKGIMWSQFIGDKRFATENIGAYEGGYTYPSDVWRPTRTSVMNSNYGNQNNFFNAPARAQIYTRIMKLSEGETWEFDYETFAEWDIKHRNSVASPSAVRLQQQSGEEELEHVPPVVVGKTWRQIMKK
jgi:hypothetical protein